MACANTEVVGLGSSKVPEPNDAASLVDKHTRKWSGTPVLVFAGDLNDRLSIWLHGGFSDSLGPVVLRLSELFEPNDKRCVKSKNFR